MAMCAEHRSKFEVLCRWWWRLQMSEKFSRGTLNHKQTKKSRYTYNQLRFALKTPTCIYIIIPDARTDTHCVLFPRSQCGSSRKLLAAIPNAFAFRIVTSAYCKWYNSNSIIFFLVMFHTGFKIVKQVTCNRPKKTPLSIHEEFFFRKSNIIF